MHFSAFQHYVYIYLDFWGYEYAKINGCILVMYTRYTRCKCQHTALYHNIIMLTPTFKLFQIQCCDVIKLNGSIMPYISGIVTQNNYNLENYGIGADS